MRPLRLVAAVVLLAALPSLARSRKVDAVPRPAAGLLRDTLHVGSAVLNVEVADSPDERTQGLSGRRTMAWDAGMLFSFPDADRRVFWMIDCSFDLDIAFLAPDGTVRDIQTMEIQPGVAPDDLRRYPSATADVMYALEVNRGWLASHGLRVGQKLPGVLRHRATR